MFCKDTSNRGNNKTKPVCFFNNPPQPTYTLIYNEGVAKLVEEVFKWCNLSPLLSKEGLGVVKQ